MQAKNRLWQDAARPLDKDRHAFLSGVHFHLAADIGEFWFFMSIRSTAAPVPYLASPILKIRGNFVSSGLPLTDRLRAEVAGGSELRG